MVMVRPTTFASSARPEHRPSDLGKLLLDGGRGLDMLTNANPAASLVRFFETVL
jgi:hypothetical protein